MQQDEAFRQAIIETPDDDTPRLVYADWLDEHGQAERAEFIRLQVRAARLDEDDPSLPALREQAEQLRAAHESAWLAPLRAALGDEVGNRLDRATFARGMLEELRLAVPGDLTRAAAEFRRWPIRRLDLLGDPAEVQALLALPELAGLEALDCRADGELFGWLGHAAHLGRLRRLRVVNELEPGDVSRLARSRLLRRLHYLKLNVELYEGRRCLPRLLKGRLGGLRGLDLGSWFLDDPGATQLAAAPLDSLEELALSHNELGSPGLAALVRAPFFGNLTALNLKLNQLDAGAAAELASAHAPRLARLNLCHNRLGDAGAAILARAPLVAGLRHLDLGDNDLTTAAVEALVAAPLDRLRELSLIGSTLDDHGAGLLAACPALRGLRRLVAYSTEVRAKGITALLDSPHLAGLRELQVDGETLGAAARKRLEQRRDPRLQLIG
jgi:uncharacterized protein (TIGR02996 family)